MRQSLRISAALLVATLLLAGPAAAEGPVLGQPAPLSLGEAGGKPVLLSDYRGKVVLVTFWNVACGPCKKQMSAFEELNKQYAAQGLQVIGVDLGDSARQYGSLLKQVRRPTMVLAHDEGASVGQAWDVVMMPNLWVVDPQGRLVAHHEGYLDADLPGIFEEIRGILAAQAPAASP